MAYSPKPRKRPWGSTHAIRRPAPPAARFRRPRQSPHPSLLRPHREARRCRQGPRPDCHRPRRLARPPPHQIPPRVHRPTRGLPSQSPLRRACLPSRPHPRLLPDAPFRPRHVRPQNPPRDSKRPHRVRPPRRHHHPPPNRRAPLPARPATPKRERQHPPTTARLTLAPAFLPRPAQTRRSPATPHRPGGAPVCCQGRARLCKRCPWYPSPPSISAPEGRRKPLTMRLAVKQLASVS